MRSSSLVILLFSLLVLPALNCAPAHEHPDLSSIEEILSPKALDSTSVESVQAQIITRITTVSTPAHLILAGSYVGTTELTGDNDGPEVERFLGAVGLAKGNPYCAAFVSYILDETPGIEQPAIRSGLASKFITDASINAKQVLRGSEPVPDGTIVVWRKGNTIFGHAGFVASQSGDNLFETIEANTSSGVYGSQRDGDGVWTRQRSIQPGNYFRITHFTPVSYG